MKTLLVWQSVPESVDWYVLDGLSKAELSVLQTAHGNFINDSRLTESVYDELDRVSAYISDPGLDYGDDWVEVHGDNIGKWFASKVEESALPTIGPIGKVFTCGFLM